jgi:hypothetical protein
MELELYAPIPDGYELVGFRLPKEGEVYINSFGEPEVASVAFTVSRCMIVRKIKPRIKRSFRVDVLDEPDRKLNPGEYGLNEEELLFRWIFNTRDATTKNYTPCIVTELPVDGE